jgi:hypothetical protein
MFGFGKSFHLNPANNTVQYKRGASMSDNTHTPRGSKSNGKIPAQARGNAVLFYAVQEILN